MDFKYFAYSENKMMAEGTVSAASPKAACEMLSEHGYRVLELKPAGSVSFDWQKWFPSFFKIKPKEIIMFSRQLALLLDSGTDIVAALELLQTQVSRRFQKILSEVVSDLRRGEPLSVALDKHPDVFPTIYRRTLAVGERTGSLEVVLRQVAEYLEKESASRKKIQGALAYPLFISGASVLTVGVLIIFVLPAFSNLYSSMGAQLPLPTRILLNSVEFLNKYGLYLMIAGLISGVVAAAYIRTAPGRRRWDKLILKLPVIGRVSLLNEMSRSCQSMALLFRAGLPLTEILALVIENSNNKGIQESFAEVRQSMLRGEGLSQPMGQDPLFPPMMVQMIKIGEETGSLDTTLYSIAQNYEIEADDKTRALIGMIQPTLSLGIGLVVAFIAISLMSAMYSIYGQMGG
jgi:type IV pilus assembly protein PilC